MFRTAAVSLLLWSVAAAYFEFGGQASAWLGAGYNTAWFGQGGLRYLPDLQFSLPLNEQFKLDADASANGHISGLARTVPTEFEARLKPYRAYLRLSSARFESRIGLQQLNFGSAMLLRPLRWFDRLDPRDPLGMTDGIWALLGRYYFQNNANLWAWGLIGNSSPKGWERFGSERWAPEFGGRAQLPVPRGELAATFHHRRFKTQVPYWQRVATLAVAEDRLGLDGKWDLGIGLSFEATLQRQHFGRPGNYLDWQRAITLGLDYTFGIGSGFGLQVEHMVAAQADEPLGRSYSGERQVTALVLSYPVSLLDNLRGFVYFDWKEQSLYRLVSWQRTYDRWLWNVSAFWNPDRPSAFVGTTSTAGKGLLFTLALNH